MPTPLAHLLDHPALWRGDDCAPVADAVASGFPELDRWLPGGGWPQGSLTEIGAPMHGIGELRLLMPACVRLTRAGRRVVLIAPPWIPYAPALAAAGLDLTQLLLVRPDSPRDALWAIEQALQSRACGAVLAWPQGVEPRSLRRLQLACERGGTLGCLWFIGRALPPVSPASLRLGLVPAADGGLDVRILKRRGSVVALPVHVRP